jgi:hypothetical protein
MGMSSYCCKGCGHELKEGEHVRLNGCVGTYDGYGCAGGFDHLEGGTPIAWHNRCYVVASIEEKLDETESKHAPNQGFGFAALENMAGYNSQAETKFQPVVYVDHYDSKAEAGTRQQYYVVPVNPSTFKLVDKYEYEALYGAANDKHPMWDETPGEDRNEAWYEQAQATIEEEIGMTSPSRTAVWFDDLNEAKRVVESLLPSLSNPDWGFEWALFGKQDEAEGIVYKYNKVPGHDSVPTGEFYEHGGPKYEYPFNGTFTQEVAFIQGRNAAESVVASY